MMRVRDAVEQEIEAIKRSIVTRPKRFSEYGRAYWDGNLAALKWVIETLDEIRSSLGKVNSK